MRNFQIGSDDSSLADSPQKAIARAATDIQATSTRLKSVFHVEFIYVYKGTRKSRGVQCKDRYL